MKACRFEPTQMTTALDFDRAPCSAPPFHLVDGGPVVSTGNVPLFAFVSPLALRWGRVFNELQSPCGRHEEQAGTLPREVKALWQTHGAIRLFKSGIESNEGPSANLHLHSVRLRHSVPTSPRPAPLCTNVTFPSTSAHWAVFPVRNVWPMTICRGWEIPPSSTSSRKLSTTGPLGAKPDEPAPLRTIVPLPPRAGDVPAGPVGSQVHFHSPPRDSSSKQTRPCAAFAHQNVPSRRMEC